MPTGTVSIFASKDGYVNRTAQFSWELAHDEATGTGASSTSTTSVVGIRASITGPGRGSGWYVSRCFFSFDTSSINNVPKSAQFRVRGITNNAITVIHTVKATSDIESAITTADFDSIEGWDARNDNTGNVTYYGATTSSWSTSSVNIIALNQQALVDMAGQDRLNIALLANRDIDDTGGNFPAPSATEYSGVIFTEYAGTTSDPFLKVELQDDSVFFGANF